MHTEVISINNKRYLIYTFIVIGLMIIFINLRESRNRIGEDEVLKFVIETDTKISKIVDKTIQTRDLELIEASINKVRKEDRELRDIIGLNSEYAIIEIHNHFLINSFGIMEQRSRMIKMGKTNSLEYENNIKEYKETYEKLLDTNR